MAKDPALLTPDERAAIEAEAMADMRQMIAERRHLDIRFSPVAAFAVLANIQLAMRHPKNQGASSLEAKRIAKIIEEWIGKTPALRIMCALGWLPEADEPHEA
jgi:hypothetical protein